MPLSLRSSAVAILLALTAQPVAAQRLTGSELLADSARREIERATAAGDVGRLLAVRRMLDSAIAVAPNNALLLHYQGYDAYRLANLADPVTQVADRVGYLATARYMLRRSIARRTLPESYMLLAAVESRLGTMDTSLAARLIADAEVARQTALNLPGGSDNPRVLLLSAIAALYTPPAFDGGPAAAEQLLTRAIAHYRTDRPAPPLPSWGRAEAYAWLGQVYERTGRQREALAAYDDALRLEPHFAWVRDALLPALKARMR